MHQNSIYKIEPGGGDGAALSPQLSLYLLRQEEGGCKFRPATPTQPLSVLIQPLRLLFWEREFLMEMPMCLTYLSIV